MDGGQNPRLSEKSFVDDLIKVATERAKVGDNSVLENYYGAIEKSIENELLIAKKEQKKAEATLKEKTRSLQKTQALIGVIVATTFPLIIAIALLTAVFAGIVSGIMRLFGYPLSSTPLILGATAAYTAIKGSYDYRIQSIEESKNDLAEITGLTESLKNSLEVTKDIKNNAKLVIEITKNLEQKKSKDLDLSQKNIPNMGVKIVCAYLAKSQGLPSCERLLLANNQITETGAAELAKTLTAQTKSQFSGINVREIDLRGNPIGANGVKELQEMLLKNFTVTNCSYDHSYTLKDKTLAQIPNTLIDQIDKQLIINRYLQGIAPLGMTDERIKTLFPPNGHTQLQKAALAKVSESFDSNVLKHLTVPDHEIASQVKAIISQNDLLLEMRSQLPNPSIKTIAFAINTAPERCTRFILTKLTTEQRKQIETTVKDNILVLQSVFDLEKRKQLLRAIFTAEKDSEKNIEVLANLLENLPKDKTIDTTITDSIQKACAHLNTESALEFKAKLENKRQQISQQTDLSDEQKKMTLKAFDLALHPELGTDYEAPSFKKYRLQKLITDHPDSPETAKQAFKEFIELYKTMPLDSVASFFSGVRSDKFLELVRTDIYNGTNVLYTQLRQLGSSNPQHLQCLFEYCFKSESEGAQKAALLTRMISKPNMFEPSGAAKSDYANLLYYAFSWPRTLAGKIVSFITARLVIPAETGVYSYKELTRHLETERRNLAQSPTTNSGLIKEIDSLLHPELEASPSTLDTKKYKLQKLVTDHPSSQDSLRQTFQEFVDGYKDIPEDQATLFLSTLDVSEFTKLALADIAKGSTNSVICTQLDKLGLGDTRRLALLELAFKNGELKKELDKKILETIAAKNIQESERLDSPLQAVLQKNLMKQFTCLKEPSSKIDFDKLQIALATNYDLRTFESSAGIDPEVKAQIDKITRQNNFFLKLAAELPNATASTIETAFNIDHQRCANFIATQLTSKQRSQLQETLGNNVMALQNFSLAKRQLLLATIFATEKDTGKNIEILTTLMEKLPKEMSSNPKIVDTLQKACKHLHQQSATAFKEKLQSKRQQISQLTDISHDQKEALLSAFDLALHPELGDTNSLEFKKYKLQKLVTDHPTTPDALKGTFKELLDIYQKIPEDEAIALLTKLNVDEFTKLAIADFSDAPTNSVMCNKTILSALGNNKRSALLKLGFKNEKLKTDLNQKRQEALATGDVKKAEELDYPLQALLQKRFLEKYAALPKPLSPTNLQQLKIELENNHDLRKLELPDGVDEQIKKHVKHVINTNKLLDIITAAKTTTEKFRQFLAIYSELAPDKERQSCLQDFKKIGDNAALLLNLVKNDINKNNFNLLKSIPEPMRTELLETCLKNDHHAHGTASVVAQLITLTSTQTIKSDYIWRIFSWPGTIWGEYPQWNFATYIKELNKLKDSKPDAALKIDKIIQNVLKEDLISRFNCLRDEPDNPHNPKSSFESLKAELHDNYDLIEFDQTIKNTDVKNYVKFICQRNLLHRFALTKNWSDFIQTYSGLDITDCEKVLLNQDRLKTLECIKQDLGSPQQLTCIGLKNLKEESLIHLLKHCSAIGPSETKTAEQKAILLSKMLKLEVLFDPKYRNEKVVKDITSVLYWSLSTEGGFMRQRKNVPYYSFAELRQKLETIKNDLEKNKYAPISLDLRNAITTTVNKTLIQIQEKPHEVALDNS